jgi:hypothetical protein
MLAYKTRGAHKKATWPSKKAALVQMLHVLRMQDSVYAHARANTIAFTYTNFIPKSRVCTSDPVCLLIQFLKQMHMYVNIGKQAWHQLNQTWYVHVKIHMNLSAEPVTILHFVKSIFIHTCMRKHPRHNESIPAFLKEHDCGLLVCDFASLRIGRTWRTDVSESIGEVRGDEWCAMNASRNFTLASIRNISVKM